MKGCLHELSIVKHNHNFKDLSNLRFGSLIPKFPVIRGKGKNRKAYWECVCDCGAILQIRGSSLTTGNTKSCGCTRDVHTPLGLKNTFSKKLQNSWYSAKARCYNPAHPSYHNYGGRGVIMDESFLNECGLINWCLTLGEPPTSKHSVDRIDPFLNYTPDNIQWSNAKEQANNKRNSKH